MSKLTLADFREIFEGGLTPGGITAEEFDAAVAQREDEIRAEAADLADRWLSNAQNFPYTFTYGAFYIERNDAAHRVPKAILQKINPPHEPTRARNE